MRNKPTSFGMNGIAMQKVDFIFLHGFLGLPSDWDEVINNVKAELEENSIEVTAHVPDYFNRPNLGPKNSLDKAASEFLNWCFSNTSNQRKILIGYSLGGRIALHIFEKNPDLFERFICVSAHPGFKPFQDDEIKERDARDHFWADLFLHHNWPELLQKWNEQSAFDGSDFEPTRDGEQFRRDLLSKSLVNWSLSKQADKRLVLRKYHKKITWVVGERDKKFIELTRSLVKEVADLKVEIISEAGHRVLFDNPFDLARSISNQVKNKT